MSQTAKAIEHAKQQARAQLDSIVDLMAALKRARSGEAILLDGEEMDGEALEERAREWPLSVLVRSGWSIPGGQMTPTEYELLLCTGGPAVRIRGEISEYGDPATAMLECQDWFTRWEPLIASTAETDALVGFAALFWFGG